LLFLLAGEGEFYREGLAPLSAGYSLKITGRLKKDERRAKIPLNLPFDKLRAGSLSKGEAIPVPSISPPLQISSITEGRLRGAKERTEILLLYPFMKGRRLYPKGSSIRRGVKPLFLLVPPLNQ
jgi:hypothetical protein